MWRAQTHHQRSISRLEALFVFSRNPLPSEETRVDRMSYNKTRLHHDSQSQPNHIRLALLQINLLG